MRYIIKPLLQVEDVSMGRPVDVRGFRPDVVVDLPRRPTPSEVHVLPRVDVVIEEDDIWKNRDL